MTLRDITLLFFVASAGYCQRGPSIYVHTNTPDTTLRLQIISADRDSASIRVKDKKFSVVSTLTRENFVVVSAGDTAEILSCEAVTTTTTSDLALSFIFDNSGSMFSAYDSLTSYADTFIDSLGDGFEANALTFDEIERKANYERSQRGTMYIALSGFTSERKPLKRFWHSYDSIRTDYTPLNDALLTALEQIHERRKKNTKERQDIIILVTDGADNASKTTLTTLQELAKALGVTIYSINYNNKPNSKLEWLTRKTGGKHFNCYDLVELRTTLERVRSEITSGYTVRYRFPFRGASSPK